MDKISLKIYAILFPVLISVISWMVKSELAEIVTTLKEINAQVYQLTSESRLLKQEMDFRFKAVEAQIRTHHPSDGR